MNEFIPGRLACLNELSEKEIIKIERKFEYIEHKIDNLIQRIEKIEDRMSINSEPKESSGYMEVLGGEE